MVPGGTHTLAEYWRLDTAGLVLCAEAKHESGVRAEVYGVLADGRVNPYAAREHTGRLYLLGGRLTNITGDQPLVGDEPLLPDELIGDAAAWDGEPIYPILAARTAIGCWWFGDDHHYLIEVGLVGDPPVRPPVMHKLAKSFNAPKLLRRHEDWLADQTLTFTIHPAGSRPWDFDIRLAEHAVTAFTQQFAHAAAAATAYTNRGEEHVKDAIAEALDVRGDMANKRLWDARHRWGLVERQAQHRAPSRASYGRINKRAA